MNDKPFVSWHMLGCTWGLRLPIKQFHGSMLSGKNITNFVESSLFK